MTSLDEGNFSKGWVSVQSYAEMLKSATVSEPILRKLFDAVKLPYPVLFDVETASKILWYKQSILSIQLGGSFFEK